MTNSTLRDQISLAVAQQWQDFARQHPHLAAVLDADLLSEHAVQSLADDPDFRAAMDRAAAVGDGAQALTDIARQFVRQWLAKLL